MSRQVNGNQTWPTILDCSVASMRLTKKSDRLCLKGCPFPFEGGLADTCEYTLTGFFIYPVHCCYYVV